MKIILILWQLPQFILAKLVYKVLKKNIVDEKDYKGVTIFLLNPSSFSGVSFGPYIFIKKNRATNSTTKDHEYGHSIQSKLLGPLYLLIVGIPSITMNLISRRNMKFRSNYYNRFPENWADKLGGVSR